MIKSGGLSTVSYCIGVDMAGQPIYVTHYLWFDLNR